MPAAKKQFSTTNLRLPEDIGAAVRALCADTHLSLNETVVLSLRGMLALIDAPADAPAPMPKLVALGRAARSARGKTLDLAAAQ